LSLVLLGCDCRVLVASDPDGARRDTALQRNALRTDRATDCHGGVVTDRSSSCQFATDVVLGRGAFPEDVP
jgi:hypothetical protein